MSAGSSGAMAKIVSAKGKISRAAFGSSALVLLFLVLSSQALAVPFHARAKALDVTGLNHACGVAVDSKGDLYASSAGESKVNVYNASHTLLTSIADAHEPCGLAVTTTGVLYVSERATGEVVQFKPNAYPFSGTPSYGSREVIDASGKAKGIAVDRFDDALYVAEGNHVSAYVHELQTVTLQDITGGSFKLKFPPGIGGQETASIKFDASAEEVKAALAALSTIGAGNVEVVKYPGSGEVFSSYYVFFTGKFAYTDVETMGAVNSLTGTINPRIGVAERAKGQSGQVGEGALTEASGVAAFTYWLPRAEVAFHYLWAADANGLLPDRLELLSGQSLGTLKAHRELTGSTTPDGSFGFGVKGAYLAADPGDRDSEGKCLPVGEEACSEGHLFLYDAAHKALDDFDASGEYLDQIRNAAFADAEPSAVAIDRSGASNDGTLYVTAGSGAGAKALAFGPLKAPARKVLKKPSEEAGGLSQDVASVVSVATGPFGYLYAAQASLIHVYKPNGAEVKTEGGKVLIEDKFEGKGAKPFDIAVDSTCKVYVLDERGGAQGEELVSYYTPSACPPTSSTTYTRQEPSVVTPAKFPNKDNLIQAIAINQGPSAGKDRLFVTTRPETQEYASAANGSGLLNEKFAAGLELGNRLSLAVNGANGNVWFGGNPKRVSEVDPSGKEVLTQFENTGASNGKIGSNPFLAVDQSNNHVITFDGSTSSAREYDAAGSFVAQFGNFTEGLVKSYEVAVDNGCAIHEPPLSGKACEEFDPANGTAYVAFADTSATHPPYNGVNAFGPLRYSSEPAKRKLTVERKGTGSGTVKGGSSAEPNTIDCGSTCEHEYLETEVVTLTAKAAAGSEFVKWTGCEAETASSTEGTCEVTMDEARKVVAEFEKIVKGKEFPLEVVFKGPGTGKVTSSPDGIDCESTCSGMLPEGQVTLTAEEAQGSEFVEWSGCEAEPKPVSGNVQCEVSGTEAKVVVEVEFVAEQPMLTVSKEGSGSGEVTSSPAGIDCGSICSHKFDLGDEVTLTAEEEPGSVFTGWTGCDSELSETECEVEMSEPRHVTATFAALPQVLAKQASPVLYDEATLRGEIDPSGLATEYRFEYLSEEEYEDNGEAFDGAQKTPKGQLAAGEGFVAVEAPLLGLEEGTKYRFRLRAMNSVGPAEDEGTFETLQRSTSPACPNGAYRFGLSAKLPDCRAYELVTPAQTNGLIPEAVASGTSPSGGFSNWLTPQQGEAAGERLSYFTSGTLPGFEGNGLIDGYRAERGAGDHPVGGWQSKLFSPSYTQAAPNPPSIQLGVASDQLYSLWEINPGSVTFPDTLPHGIYLRTPTGFEALGDPEALAWYASPGGTHAIFTSTAHLDPEAPPVENAALYDHGAGSAATHVLTLAPHNASVEEAEFADALRSKRQSVYQGANEDGSAVVFKAGVGLYVRLDDAKSERISPRDAQVGDTLDCAAGPLYEGSQELDRRHFEWLRDGTPIPGASGNDLNNVSEYIAKAADEGAALQCLTVAAAFDPHSVAVSAPVWIAPLEADQAPQPPAQIAAPTPASPVAGTIETCNPGSWQGATSLSYQWYRNGQEISGATSQTYKVQAADVPGTLQCIVTGANAAATVSKASGLTSTSPAPSEAAPVATAQALPTTTYAGTSEDGRYIFFALGKGDSSARLFRFNTQSEETTEIAKSGIFALVSPDGSRAFFSSEEVLTGSEENENGEAAKAGAHNLYAWDGTTTRFVGRLSASDFQKGGFPGAVEMTLASWTQAIGHTLAPVSGRAFAPTRSTPAGETFVFQSHARLTAFDNGGVGEIYRYDPAAAAGERLLCVSCDPSGSPPSADALLEDIRNGLGRPSMRTTMIANVTDGGDTVFFDSFDRLSPEDVNDVEDVYEWEAKGSGGCTRLGGCLALISSGQGEKPSGIYSMSANGHDVFFYTQEKLVGLDVTGSPSIYDARVGGGIPEPAEPAPCQGDACQGQGSEAPALPNLNSGGPGEEPRAETPVTRKPCAKGRHRVKGRCVAKHKHRKRHRRIHTKQGGSR